MDRNREARRASSIVGSNGFNRRRHRTNSLRDSPDEVGVPELQESVRLRDRLKKDRDLRERSSRSKRRRADIAGDDTSEESVNDEEDDDEEDEEIAAVRFSSPAPASTSNHHHGGGGGHSSSFSQQHHHNNSNSNNNQHLQHRKTFPPNSSSSTARVARAPPPVWKPGDEMISVAFPRKARSASSKRSHEWISSSNNSGNADQNPAQPSSSPVIHGHMPAAPTSPSSSMKKKLKHGPNHNLGSKMKPPKASSLSAKPSSSNAEELEIEIAEVLYGLMTQSQEPPSSKKDEFSRFNGDVKTLDSNSSPLSAVAPKRKKPRQVPEGQNFGFRSSPMAKPEPETPTTDQTTKSEISSPPKSERISGSAAENGGSEIGGISVISHAQPPVPETRVTAEELREDRDLITGVKEDLGSPKEQEYPAVRDRDRHFRGSPLIAIASLAPTTINANFMVSEVENKKEVKFEIDLMAPPPERETKFDTRPISVGENPVLSTLDAPLPVVMSKDNEDEKGNSGSGNNTNSSNVATSEGKVTEEDELNKAVELKDSRNLNLRHDLEKAERDISSSFSANENKSQLAAQEHQQPVKLSKEEQSRTAGHSRSSLSLTMPVASWPGGLPPMGYMAPLQGVVTVDGGGLAPLQPLFSQPRPKRCATHCHIAKNIHYLQQFIKMNPFWPAPGGTPPVAASLFGSKPCAIPSAVPPASDFNAVIKGVNNAQDRKGQQNSAGIPNNVGKGKGSQSASSSDSAKMKPQILIQQPMPPVAPSNLMGPGFIFPINQQQVAVAAAATRPSPGAKSPTTVAPFNAVSTSGGPSSTSSPAPMSFNYSNMSPNETQYLAILQNNAYPFPIPTVGPPPNYRGGPPAQSMSLFNGPFYSSQIIHPQLQHSQQQASNQPPQMMQVQHTASSGQMMLAHHNANARNNSSSSQKYMQTQQQQQQQQQRPQNSFSSQKAQPQPHNNQFMHGGGIDDNSPSSTADNRGSRATSVNIYGPNFAMPIHSQTFALLTSSNALPVANTTNQAEKKSSCQSQQQQGMKPEVESLVPHTFAMSFGPGIDAVSMAQSHAMFQNCTDGARQNIQMMAAAPATQIMQKNSNFRTSEEAKSGNSANLDNSSVREDERKTFAFADVHTASSTQANNNAGPACNSRTTMSNGSGAMNSVQNAQFQQQQQQHMLQLKHQQQQQQLVVNTVNRTNKPPGTSNGSIYSEHLNSSSMMGGKFPNTISPVFPQNLVQRSNSPTPSPSQSPQWKSSTRAPVSSSQAGLSSLGSSIQTMHKNPPQQHSRNQPPMQGQISFGGNKKHPATPLQQGQGPPPSGNQGPSSPMMMGSPTTSSLSKGTSGSPRTNSSASTSNNKTVGLHASPFNAQPPKNSPSILGNPKPQMQQQQSQQKNMQQSQLFFSNPYSQSPHLSSGGPGAATISGYYVPQRRSDQHQRAPHGASTNDPATAIAAATSNAKGGGLQTGGMMAQASPLTLLPAGYSYVHPVPAGVQMKPAEQKQPAGNDNLHQWQPEKK